jgi:hypothetical protein
MSLSMESEAPVYLARRAAKAMGSIHYWTGRQCKHGHVAYRFTSTGQCMTCMRSGPPRMVGNPKHRALRAAYVSKPCEECGNLIPYEQRKNRFCSQHCTNKAMWRKRDGKSCHKQCRACGVLFLAKPAEFYCGDACRVAGRATTGSTRERIFSRLLLLRGRKNDLTRDDLRAAWDRQGGRCALTGLAMTVHAGKGRVGTNVSIDRIDAARGYEPDNIQLTCVTPNRMKMDMPDDLFVAWCRMVVDHHDNVLSKAA